MKWTEEKLEELTELAKLQFLPPQIATIMEVEEDVLIGVIFSDEPTPAKKAYDKGLLLAEAELRSAIILAAKQGGTPAQKEFIKMIREREKQMAKLKRKYQET